MSCGDALLVRLIWAILGTCNAAALCTSLESRKEAKGATKVALGRVADFAIVVLMTNRKARL